MKKHLLLVALIAFNSLAVLHAGPVLKLNLEKGKEYKLISKSTQNMLMTMNGMQINTEVNGVSAIKFHVESLETDYMLITITFDSIISNVTNPYKTIKINSNKPGNPKNPDDLMNNVMHTLSKNPLKVKLSYIGKVIEITNLQAFTDSVMKQLDSLPESTKPLMKPQIENSVGLDMLKVMIESPVSYLSGNKISEGDKWDSKFVMKPNGMELTITTSFKCKNIKGDVADLAGDIVIESPENAIMSMNGMQIPYDLRGMGTSENSINLSTGWLIKSKGRQKMQGSMTFNGNAAPIEIETSYEAEAVQ